MKIDGMGREELRNGREGTRDKAEEEEQQEEEEEEEDGGRMME